MTSRESQTLLLPDGRVLGFAEYGSPNGYPLLFFHGFPTSRLDGWGADQIGRKHNVRIVAPDRPGYGLSTFQPNRRITDWPADVEALTRHLKVSHFSILGGSGGGPYALACANSLPQSTMHAVGVFSGAPAWKAGREKMHWARRALSVAVTYFPTGVRIITDVLVGMARWIVRSGPVTRRLDKWIESLKKQEDKTEAKPLSSEKQNEDEPKPTVEERRERLLGIVFEAFAQGSRGAVQEAELLSSQDWGFDFEHVSYPNIKMWHGTRDTDAPIDMIRYMAKRLPHCELHEYVGENHQEVANHLEDIILQLVPKKTEQETSS